MASNCPSGVKKSSLDAGKITAEALQGIGNGGGHAAMAGGFVPFTGSDGKAVIFDRSDQGAFFFDDCKAEIAQTQSLQSRRAAIGAEPEECK